LVELLETLYILIIAIIKMVLRLVILFLPLFFFAQVKGYDNDSLIVWNKSRKLSWNDFKNVNRSNLNSPHFAEGEVSIEYNLKNLTVDEIPELNVVACFYKKKSWSVSTSKETLLHEQLHFDITEIFARKIRRAFSVLKAKNILDIQEYYNVYNEFFDEMESYQKKYDNETIFLRVKVKEKADKTEYEVITDEYFNKENSKLHSFGLKKWKNKVEKELKVLEEYKLEFKIENETFELYEL